VSPARDPTYWLHKLANRKTGFPLATVAYYGPDNTFASKVVVGIVVSAQDDNDIARRTWCSETVDVRQDTGINQQILDYVTAQQVQRVTLVDRLIGCPHQEGVDYPAGEACPQCPYWAQRDRWTGELIR
jgi:hypothetical protein